MAYAPISKPSLHFNTKLYTGNGANNHAITGVGFAPDWVWQKRRDNSNGHVLFDKVRGATKILQSESASGEITSASGQDTVSLDSDGFTVAVPAQTGGINPNGASCVAWNWKAAGTSGSTNNDGNVATTVAVNTTAGFSIVTYTGTGNAGATIGHGLGAVPNWIVIKKRAGGSSRDWAVYHSANTSAPETEILYLNNTDATADSAAYWNDTAPTSSIITLGAGNEVNESNTHTYVAYCFAEKKGYSKFGKYTGNGNADGAFVYTGFKPAFVIAKQTDSSDNWALWDNKREPFNVNDNILRTDTSAAETSNAAYKIDFLSNGFKLRGTDTKINGNGNSYVYMSFAEEPLVANVGASIPATAR